MKKIIPFLLLFWSCTKENPTSTIAPSQPLAVQSKPSTQLSQTSPGSFHLSAQDGHSVVVVNEDNGGATVDSVFFLGSYYIAWDTTLVVPKDQIGNMTVYVSHKPAGYFVECFVTGNSDMHPGEENMDMPDYTTLPTDSCQFFNVNTDSLTQITLKRG